MKDLAPKPSSGRRKLAQSSTSCFFELERSKKCSNFFESCCFLKRSKACSKRWTRGYFFLLFSDVPLISTSETLIPTSQPSIKKFMQNVENNMLYNFYVENIEDFDFHLSTIVQATLQLGALQISARLVHYSMGVAYKNISPIFPGNEIAYGRR